MIPRILSVLVASGLSVAEARATDTLAPAKPPAIVQSAFGRMPDGTQVDEFTLTNDHGLACKVITYGAAIIEMDLPDREGKFANVVLGCGTLKEYLKPAPYFGAVIGRVSNRIAKGHFTLDGKTYALTTNRGVDHAHGGFVGFDKVLWAAKPIATPDGPAVEFHYFSKDGEEGYPGNLDVTITYLLSNRNLFQIDYVAKTDKPTLVNLTNHTYWNLAGHGDVLGHVLMLNASHYTPVDDGHVPTGEIASVAGTPLDFTRPKPIGRNLAELTGQPRGYDYNFVIDHSGRTPTLAARAFDPKTGRAMEIYTNQPGIQFYSGNFLDGTIVGREGEAYQQYGGFCLETQHFADAVHHPNFPSIVLRPGETYHTTTIYQFLVQP